MSGEPRPVGVDKSPGRIREMFDRISPTYDLLNRVLSLSADVRWRRRAARTCATDGGRPARILDLACGTGDLAIEIRRRWGGIVVGADFADRMLRVARRKARGGIPLVQADALRLPFRDAAFDACMIAFGLRNLADPRRGLAEMTRVVRPGGRVVVLEFTLPRPALLRRIYLAYFNRLLPLVGGIVSGSRAYHYLSRSVHEWCPPDRLGAWMQDVGLKEVAYVPLSFGIAALQVGTRVGGSGPPGPSII